MTKIQDMTKLLMISSSYPRFQGDYRGIFIRNLFFSLKNELPMKLLIPDHAGGVATDDDVYTFSYFFKKSQLLTYGHGILNNIRRYPLLALELPFFIIAQVWAIRKRIRDNPQIKIIHAHWILPQGLSAVLYKLLFNKKIKILCTSHGSDIFALRGKLAHWIKRFILHNIDHLTVVSNALKSEIQKLRIDQSLPVTVQPMGVDNGLFGPDFYSEKLRSTYANDGPLLLFVGKLIVHKGIRELINVLPSLVEKYPTCNLLVIGDGPLRAEVEARVRDLNLSNNVQLLGAIPNTALPPYYATADVFIGPSIVGGSNESEGFGLVFVEALMSQTCVITSNLPGISDIIINSKTGVCVNVKHAQQFADAILTVLADAHLRKRLALQGYAHVRDRFSLTSVASKYKKIIFDLYKE